MVEKPFEGWDLRFPIEEAARAGTVVVRLTGRSIERGAFRMGPLDLEIDWGERVALTGANGTGKSTLVAALLGPVPLTAGVRWIGPSVVVGELGQDRRAMGGPTTWSGTVHGAVSAGPGRGQVAAGQVRPGRRARDPIGGSLSPGERTRAELAMFQGRGVNFLVLDEPTNHLDLPAIEQLESALAGFGGTLLLVSHDRSCSGRWTSPARSSSRTVRDRSDQPTGGAPMLSTVTDAWRTLVPPDGDRHGPLAPLLVTLTVVTGLVDAFSYLVLGHVFVANMTGNVVFLAFALTGAKGFSIAASLSALGAFFVGALCSGRLVIAPRPTAGTDAGDVHDLPDRAGGGGPRGWLERDRSRHGRVTLRPHRTDGSGHGDAERHGPQAGRARPDHHGADPDHRRCGIRRPRGRWDQLAHRPARALGPGHVLRSRGRCPLRPPPGQAGRSCSSPWCCWCPSPSSPAGCRGRARSGTRRPESRLLSRTG